MPEDRTERNQVFASAPQQPQHQSHPPVVSAADKLKADFGLDVPVDIVPLPSCGRAYPLEFPLHNVDSVEIRAMTAREEDILTSRALLKKGTVISELIKSCLVNKAVDPKDLLVGDRNAVMVAIRVTGYGPDYDVELECGECGSKASKTFNLGELSIRRLGIDPVAEGMNLFEYKLPMTKKVVRFRFLTGRDEEEILATSEKQKKLGLGNDSSVTTNLLYSIVSIDGIDDRAKIAGFVRNMLARDSLALRNYIKNNEPGIIMRQEVTCPSCGNSEEAAMPLSTNFFWPDSL